MDIGSISSVSQGFNLEALKEMRGRSRPTGDPEEDAKKFSTEFLEENDADGDGLLSFEELDFDSEQFAKIDTDGDNLLSQSELQSDMQSHMQEMQAQFQAGEKPPTGGLQSGAGGSLIMQMQGSKLYEQIQQFADSENMSGENQTSYLLESLNLVA